MSHLVEKIRSRCEEIGDCWEWQGARHKNGGAPMVNHQGRPNQVRRILAMAAGMNCCGKVVTNRCRNILCVNPEHIQLMLRQTLQRRTAKEHAGAFMNPASRAKVAQRQRLRSPLTPQIVEVIRADPRSQRTIAAAYGISQSSVSQIKRGARWQDYGNPFIQLFK